MKKLKLDLNSLDVETFSVAKTEERGGTVIGRGISVYVNTDCPCYDSNYTCYTCPGIGFCTKPWQPSGQYCGADAMEYEGPLPEV